MKQDEVNEAVPEGPQIKAETWFALAIAAFAITAVIFGLMGLWIFTEDAAQALPRAQAFTPFGAALIAIVTFFTIAWRGVLNTRQLEYQADQIVQSRRQNDAKDDENLARLLQDGAKLVGEYEKPPHVLAGIATLSVVVQDPKKRFGEQAMDILADFILYCYNEPKLQSAYAAAARAMGNGADNDLRSSAHISLTRPIADDRSWIPVRGVRASYSGGTARRVKLSDFDLKMPPHYDPFMNVQFEMCEVDQDVWVENCTFVRCKITLIDGDVLGTSKFISCDFSGARISSSVFGHSHFTEGSGGNYYRRQTPPEEPGDFNWKTELTVRE